MAALSSIAVAGLAVAGVSTAASIQQGRQSRKASQRAADEQSKIASEQRAQNASSAAAERRQQIREERVRRGAIMNAAANTGTAGSSGVIGAVGSLSTQLSSNMGANQGAIMRGQRISGYAQNAANYNTSAANFNQNANTLGQVAGLGTSIFSAAGGFESIFGTKGK